MAATVPPRLSIVTLGVADLTRATDFYESLGWRRSSSSLDGGITFFQLEGSVLGLYGWEALAEDAGVDHAGSGFRGTTLALNCASVEEVDALYAAWLDCGGSGVKEPQQVFWGGYSSYVADPDGHLWELVHNPYAQTGPDGRLVLGPPAD